MKRIALISIFLFCFAGLSFANGITISCDSSSSSVEGTAVLSTGEVGGTKFLREDGDGTSSWQAALTSSSISDTAYSASWDGVTTIAPNQNTVYDKIQTLQPLIRYETLYIDAGAMTACITNPAAAGINEYATNDVTADYFAFDGGATEECSQFKVVMPENWDLGTIKSKFFWSSATGSTAGDTTEFGLQCGAISNDDALDTAFGTAQVISDTLLATNGTDLQVSGATPAITVGGSPALADVIFCRIYRNTDGTDDMTEDAWLFGALIQYSTSGSPAAW